jgi:hypothetical protein
MIPILQNYIDGLDKVEPGEQLDEFFLKLALWVERSFVANRSTGDEQLQTSELPRELLECQLSELDGRELGVWLVGKLSTAEYRDGALDAMRMLPGHLIAPLLSSVIINESSRGPKWSDRQVSSMLDTLSFRLSKETTPRDLAAFQAALSRWSIGRNARIRELTKQLREKCERIAT